MINIIMIILIIFLILLLIKIWKLNKIVDHYKYEDQWAWPQYDQLGHWEDFKGFMSLTDYIECLEHEREILGKILTNKIYHHVGHPFNERVNVLRSVIRDLKLLYNYKYKSDRYGGTKNEVQYEYTFWRKV